MGTDEWLSVLKLAKMWYFVDIHAFAVDKITAHLDPVERIILGKEHYVIDWLFTPDTLNSPTKIWPRLSKRLEGSDFRAIFSSSMSAKRYPAIPPSGWSRPNLRRNWTTWRNSIKISSAAVGWYEVCRVHCRYLQYQVNHDHNYESAYSVVVLAHHCAFRPGSSYTMCFGASTRISDPYFISTPQ